MDFGFPKAELHLHIEGTLEPELMFQLARRNNIKLPFSTVDELKEAYKFNNLQEFLDIYYQGANVLVEEKDFYDLTFAYLSKAHSQNIVHVEFFFDPQTHISRGVDFAIVFNGIYNATVDAKKEFGITSFIIMSFLRHLSEDEAFKILDQSLAFKDKIIGVGLDSSELGNPPEKFEKVFKKSKELGFKLVAHAGEEGPVDYIWSAIKKLEVDRVDHGNTSLNDERLVRYLIENEIALTVCPLSNLALKVCHDLKKHPIKKMIGRGMVVTVNSDDPSYFGGYINENFQQICDSLNLTKEDVKILVKNSFKASFLDDEKKLNWMREVDFYFDKN
jgi:adenosine deaminase